MSLGTGGLFLYLASRSLSDASGVEKIQGDYNTYSDSKAAARNRGITSLVLGGVGLISTDVGVFLMMLKTPLT